MNQFLQGIHLLGAFSVPDKIAQPLQHQSWPYLNQTNRAVVQKSEGMDHKVTLTSGGGEPINCTEMPASRLQCLKAVLTTWLPHMQRQGWHFAALVWQRWEQNGVTRRCWWELETGTFAWWLGAWQSRMWWASWSHTTGELSCISGFELPWKLGSVPTSSWQNRRFCYNDQFPMKNLDRKYPADSSPVLRCTVPFLFAFSILPQDLWDRTHLQKAFISLSSSSRTCLSAGLCG